MRAKKIISVAMLLLLFVPSLSAASAPLGSAAPDFHLKDQFNNEFRLSDVAGETVLIVCGDREGSKYMNPWGIAVRQKYPSGKSAPVRIVSIANLRGVPAFIRPLVKQTFLKPGPDSKPTPPVLLDWEGQFARLYGFQSQLANVYLIDRTGVLRFVIAGKGTSQETDDLLGALEKVLDTSGPSAKQLTREKSDDQR